MSNYQDFLHSKALYHEPDGITISTDNVNPILFEWQRDLVAWACKRGRAAIFADCGLGKTFMQLEWARLMGGTALIVAPLCVSHQTIAEAAKLGITVNQARHGDDVIPGEINITNYEMLEHFSPNGLNALVLDESSILKNYAGKYRRMITEFGSKIAYRLACTATPAPNDFIELINHAEFLGVMSGKQILAMFFIQDGNTTHAWRLKKHAEKDFWRWMSSWCVAMRTPSDIGYPDARYDLPPLNMHEHIVDASGPADGMLFVEHASTLIERRDARRTSIEDRALAVAEMVNSSDEPWIVWCDLNAESDALTRLIPDAKQVKGSDTVAHKESTLDAFSDGKLRVLVTKPSIAGFGLNWQHCHNVAFTGLSDSYEQFYQAIRRCWRFGQTSPVDCHVVISETEGAVLKNIQRKESQAEEMYQQIVAHMSEYLSLRDSAKHQDNYQTNIERGETWEVRLGDSIELVKEIEPNSIGLCVFSPPFPGMYAYTDSSRDIGNSSTIEQLMEHIKYLYAGLFPAMKPGRSVAIHLTQMVRFKYLDGVSGLRDFRGETIRAMEDAGFVFYGEVTIDKNPQLKAQRTKDHGLLFKTLSSDSSKMHMALADYLLQFMKPGENTEPIRAGMGYGNQDGWITNDEWIEWAAPVWYRATPDYPGGIKETDVLEYREARSESDEKHICPLQLGVIERAIKLWSNPGDLVLDPFSGIGSTGYQAIRFGRRYLGFELKPSYWLQSIKHMKAAELDVRSSTLFHDIIANEDVHV